MADRMIVLTDGVAEQIGAPLDVYENPQSAFVAGFIGSPATNFLTPDVLPGSYPDGATVGIRPEHLELTDTDGRLTGQVISVEALGAETLVYLRLPGGQMIAVRQDGALPRPAERQTVSVNWADTAQMVFDGSGKRTR